MLAPLTQLHTTVTLWHDFSGTLYYIILHRILDAFIFAHPLGPDR